MMDQEVEIKKRRKQKIKQNNLILNIFDLEHAPITCSKNRGKCRKKWFPTKKQIFRKFSDFFPFNI